MAIFDETLTKGFEGLEIKENRVAESMKDECNLGIKVFTRHPVARNSKVTLEARAKWAQEWLQKGMRRLRAWSRRSTKAIIESPFAGGGTDFSKIQ